MAYDDLLNRREFLQQLSLEGKIWKLEKDTYRGPDDIKNWESCFMLAFEPNDRLFIKESMILWHSNDDSAGKLNCPRYGVAGNIWHLQFFMKNNRIHRDGIGIEQDVWDEILELDEEVVLGNDSCGDESGLDQSSGSEGLNLGGFNLTNDTPSDVSSENGTVKSATPNRILEALDKIVTFLTGRYYQTRVDVGAKYEAYINDYDHNLQLMANVWDKGSCFLPDDLRDMFRSGVYKKWGDVMRELRFYFHCDESQKSMIDFFRGNENHRDGN